jgi:protein ImuB
LRLLEARRIFAESVELEYPIVLLEPLAFLLNRMLEQVCARLSTRALAAQELRLELELAAMQRDDGELLATPTGAREVTHPFTRTFTQTFTRTFIRTLRLPMPMLDAKVFLKLLQLDLQAHPPGAPIMKIRLSAEPARPRALQSGLFQPVFPEPEKLELTLARIAGIVGEGRVGSVELLDTHREGAFAVRHFAPLGSTSAESLSLNEVRQAGKQKQIMSISMPENGGAFQVDNPLENDKPAENAREQMSAVIALRLFRPPLSASVTLREAKPWRLCLQREEIAGDIVWTAGPWRSSGDWSEQDGWSREEWDIAVTAETGLVLYRLVQDKLSGKWFLEGTYD